MSGRLRGVLVVLALVFSSAVATVHAGPGEGLPETLRSALRSESTAALQQRLCVSQIAEPRRRAALKLFDEEWSRRRHVILGAYRAAGHGESDIAAMAAALPENWEQAHTITMPDCADASRHLEDWINADVSQSGLAHLIQREGFVWRPIAPADALSWESLLRAVEAKSSYRADVAACLAALPRQEPAAVFYRERHLTAGEWAGEIDAMAVMLAFHGAPRQAVERLVQRLRELAGSPLPEVDPEFCLSWRASEDTRGRHAGALRAIAAAVLGLRK